MKKTLLAFAVVLTAASAMAADTSTGGLITFKQLNAVSLVDRAGAAYTPAAPWAVGSGASGGWFAQLFTISGNSLTPVLGTKVSTGAFGAVREAFATTTGKVNGGDWVLSAVPQGQDATFVVGAYFAPTGTEDYSFQTALPDGQRVFGQSAPFTVKTGGNELSPPATAVRLTGASFTVAVPEPSVIALGVLGMGAFLLRRRS